MKKKKYQKLPHRNPDPLKRDVRPDDLKGHCNNCKKDTYFRPRPPDNLWRCIRCLARMEEDRHGH